MMNTMSLAENKSMRSFSAAHARTGTPPGVAWSRWIRLGSIAVTVICLLAIARLVPMERLADWLDTAVRGLGGWGPFAYALVYVVATVLMLPGAALTLAAGAIFGLFWGTVAVSLGSTTGAALAFFIARYLAREPVERRLAGFPRFRAVDRAVSEGGWKIVALLRLSPALPFNLQNYLYGLTAIRFRPFVLASWLAMLPGSFMYVYLGYAGRAGVAAASGAEVGRSPAEWALLAAGLGATVVVTVYATRLARRAIQGRSAAEDRIPESLRDGNRSASVPRKGANLRVTAVHALIAVAAVVAAGCAHRNKSLLAGLFGPPQVAMTEAYEDLPGGPTFDHRAFSELLGAYVNDKGGVDYAGLITKRSALQAYIARLGEAPFDRMGRDERLALLINAYNAFTLELILEYWDGGRLRSIKDIPADRRWDHRRWQVGGYTWSLNQIEHEQIRSKFKEPRVHWALVCAAVSCPPLRTEAYTAGRLDRQFADQARRVHAHDKWYDLDAHDGTVHLTPLYDWYGGDFEQAAGSVLASAARHDPRLEHLLEAGPAPRVRWLKYDWALNTQENAR